MCPYTVGLGRRQSNNCQFENEKSFEKTNTIYTSGSHE